MAERIGIELEVVGFEEYKAKLQEAQRYTKSLSGQKLKIDFTANSQNLKRQLQEVRNQLGEYKAQIKALQSQRTVSIVAKIENRMQIQDLLKEMEQLDREAADGIDVKVRADRAQDELNTLLERGKQLDRELDELDVQIKNVQIDQKNLDAARERLNNLLRIEPAINYKAVFKAGKSIQGAIGTSLETIGNGLTSISHNVITETITGIFRQLGYGLTNLATEGLQGSVARYDILKTYPMTMEAIGFSTEQAESSIDKLNKSVLGLPTSLSDIVDVAKRYTTALGDIDRGTDLAIAANNAFLASSAEDSQKYQGMLQIADLVAGKELNAREWNSLNASMSTAMRYIGEELGYSSHQAFLQALTGGQIKPDEFIDALIASGTSGKVAELTEIAKSKLGSAIENIRNAFARGGANVIDGLDQVLTSTTGKGIVDHAKEISATIDDLAGQLVSFLKNNPQLIKEWVDKIKSVDIVGFLKGTAVGLKDTFDLFASLLKMLPGGMQGAGQFFVMAGTYGRIITTIGQFVKGFSPVGGIINVFLKWSRSGQPVFEGMGNFFKGARRVANAEGVADAAQTAGKIEKAGKSAFNIVDSLKKVASAVGIFVIVGAGVTAVIGEVLLIAKELKKLGEVGRQIDWYEATDTLEMIGVLMGLIGGLAMVIDPISAQLLVATTVLGLITTVMSGFAALDTWLIKKAAENIKAIVTNFKETSEILRGLRWDSEYTRKFELIISAMGSIVSESFWNGFGPILGTISRITTGNLDAVLDDLSSTIKSMANIANDIGEIDVPSGDTIAQVEKLILWVSEFYGLFDDDTFDLSLLDSGEIGTQESDNLNKILSSFHGALEALKGIADTALEMESSLDLVTGGEHGDKMASVRNGVHAVVYSIKQMLLDFNDIYQEINGELATDSLGLFGVLKGTFTGDTGVGLDTSSRMETLVNNFMSVLSGISGIVDAMNELASKADLLTNKDSGGKLGYAVNGVKTTIDKIKELVIYFNDMSKELNESLGGNTAGWKSFLSAGWSGDPGNGKRAIGSMSDMFSGFLSAIESVGEIMSALSNMQGSFVNLEEVGGVNGIVERIKSLIRNISEMLSTFDEDTKDVDYETIGAKIKSLSDAVGIIKDSAASLVEMSTSLTELGTTDGVFTIAQQIGDLITQLGTSLGQLEEQGLSAKAMAFSLAINALMSSIELLIGTDSTGLVGITEELGNIGEALDDLSDQFEQFFNEQESKFSNAGSKWRRALLDGLDIASVSATLSYQLDLMFRARDFSGSGYSTGRSYVNGLMSALNSFSIGNSSIAGVMNSLRLSTGGQVQYRAGGGSMFKPRGTDTVPAMLTPGEFVMRKRAVDALGTGFMAKINSLDIPGALYSLSTRAGAKLASMNPRIVNNTTNNTNNAQVTQNIFGGSQGYSLRRADRYVRAL